MTAVPAPPAGATAGSSDLAPASGGSSSVALFFLYDVVVIAGLLVLALVSSASRPAWEGWRLEWPALAFDRVIPLWVPWAGALGGATISLVGVTKYAGRWRAELRWWHLSRPLLGAVAGTFSVLVLVFVLQSIAPDVTGAGYSAKGKAVLTGIAFVVGYREETLRELVTRVADLVLGPADPTPAGPTAQPSTAASAPVVPRP